MENWDSMAAIAADLNRKAQTYDDTHFKKLTVSYQSDEIRGVEGVFVRLMNQLISFLNVSPGEASRYDFLARDYDCEVGNNIPIENASEIYDEFCSLYKKHISKDKNRGNE